MRHRAFRRAGRMRIECRGVAIERRAIRADDFLVLAHVEKNMRMIVRWRCPDTHELTGADVDYRNPRIVVKVGADMLRHGNSSSCRGFAAKFRRHHSGEVGRCLAPSQICGCRRRKALVVRHSSTGRVGVELPAQNVMRTPRIGIALLAAALLAAAAVYAVPRAADAVSNVDDPARIASRALGGAFDGVKAQHASEGAAAAQDVELAQSVIDLARARDVTIDSALAEKVAAATAEAATMRSRAKSFARGLVTGEPQDMASLAGTTLGDLFVFGDIRDALREGTRYVRGQQVDPLILGLAATGIAITAGTYATFGAATPARAGLTLVKAARKTGRLGVEFTESLGRMVQQ